MALFAVSNARDTVSTIRASASLSSIAAGTTSSQYRLTIGDNAAGQVSEPVRQLGLVARGEVLPRERTVLTKVDGAHEVIAECVSTEHVGDLVGSDAGQV